LPVIVARAIKWQIAPVVVWGWAQSLRRYWYHLPRCN